MAHLEGATAFLDSSDIPMEEEKVLKALATYDILLCVPSEYLSRSLRHSLVQRAFALDLHGGKDSSSRAALRTFPTRMLLSPEFADVTVRALAPP